MTSKNSLRDAFQLMRPAQWPILTAQFFLSVLLVSPRATTGGCWINGTSLLVLAVGWLVWVVFLNGGTLAYNSAYDRDTGPVAYLPHPPAPPPWLAGGALAWMLVGVVLGGLVIGQALAAVLLGCVVLSKLYSHPIARLKKRPGLDLLTNMVGYGAATTLAGILTGQAAYLGLPAGACPTDSPNPLAFPEVHLPILSGGLVDQFQQALSQGRIWLVLGFGFLFGSFYPNTQIYQVPDDRARGDRTLTTALGPARALFLAVILGVVSGVLFFLAFAGSEKWWVVALPMAGVILWTSHQFRWMSRVGRLDTAQNEALMYRSLTLWAVVDATILLGWMLR